MDKQAQVKALWQMVAAMLSTQRGITSVAAFSARPSVGKAENTLLNTIAALNAIPSDKLAEAIESVRAHANIEQATNRIGSEDLERINAALDKILV